MIRTLSIENFALIDAVRIDFNHGFSVITGETGSGKSILLNALNLILGERANFSVIGNRSDKSIVEAEIDIAGFGLEDFFKKNELDYFDRAIVRREIYKQGRSRAFVNDTPVQLSVLKAFTSQLIHIHSQYNTLELKDVHFQLKVLDVLANTQTERERFSELMRSYQLNMKLLADKKERLTASFAQEDYNSFQLNELLELELDKTDYDGLQEEAKKGEHADEIRSGLGDLKTVLSGESGVLDQLNYVKSTLIKKVTYDPKLQELFKRLNSVLIEVEDISNDAEGALEKVDFDPRKLDEIITKLDTYNRIMQKHGATTQDDLAVLMEELRASSQSLGELEKEIQTLTEQTQQERLVLNDLANDLHDKRNNAIPSIEASIRQALAGLKLENTVLSFQLSRMEELNAWGNSTLEILFSPNVGIAPVPVHQAASGGELSRVMLALQSLMSSKVQLRTILFDEIDTGVSGDVAQKMGSTLKKMGSTMQVIAITHLPQVAAKGGQHLKVSKSISDGISTTSVIELSTEERIEETARLMSGDEINAAALENAKSLMQ